MSRSHGVSPWIATVSSHLPTLSVPQARVLALWSYAVVVTQYAGTSSAATFLAELLGQKENSVRQRLREWYLEPEQKRGAGRQAVDAAPCFAALLGWVLAWWPTDEPRLALALDATTLGERFTVLSLSVVYRSCAIPVAWAITRANTPGAWRPHWERLLRQVGGHVPADWVVLVLADRGLYARWLYQAIQQQHWHPFLRVTTSGLCQPTTPTGLAPSRRVADLVSAVGERWCGEAVCFSTPARALRCTVLACWEEPHTDRWLILTDLAPAQAQVAWYGLRGWIEQGFKDLKRGGWGWHNTKMTEPARAERYWVVLAVATLWTVSVGSDAEARLLDDRTAARAASPVAAARAAARADTVSQLPPLPPAPPRRETPRRETPRRLSVFRRGRLTLLADLIRGHQPPLGFFPRSLWPGEQAAAPQTVSGLPPLAIPNTYP